MVPMGYALTEEARELTSRAQTKLPPPARGHKVRPTRGNLHKSTTEREALLDPTGDRFRLLEQPKPRIMEQKIAGCFESYGNLTAWVDVRPLGTILQPRRRMRINCIVALTNML